ncbi:MAG: hypothetical protein ABR585_14285, partial [Gemmatimonadaceae bacterium]
TLDYGATVWNDVRNAADCPAIDSYRQDLADAITSGSAKPLDEDLPEIRNHSGDQDKAQGEASPMPPAVQSSCLPTFGNTDIFGGSYPDPSP